MSLAETRGNLSNSSFFGYLWRAWSKRRRRVKARLQSQVRFRLTREGFHFVGILLFIFLGAILRDINLLILLAGSMIGLLLLQWRFNARTLLGLTASRSLPRTTSVDRPTRVTVRVTNPKPWLGAWLLIVRDPLQRILPSPKRLSEQGMAVVDEVRPRGQSETSYELTFHQRGRFRVGPSSLSTRFPLCLGVGLRTLDDATELTVFPKQGQLTRRCESLFHQEMQGNARMAPKSGVHEAEFYGLRPWATGDSRRWIHWRTTARLGELSVRQFERQQRRQINILLDLWEPKRKSNPQESTAGALPIEQAISFVATLASHTAMHGSDRLAVAVAASENYAMPSVQSAVLVESLLERLATISAHPRPNIAEVLQGIGIPLLTNPELLVVSNREQQDLQGLVADDAAHQGLRRLLQRLRIKWLNVSQGDLEPYFSWT